MTARSYFHSSLDLTSDYFRFESRARVVMKREAEWAGGGTVCGLFQLDIPAFIWGTEKGHGGLHYSRSGSCAEFGAL